MKKLFLLSTLLLTIISTNVFGMRYASKNTYGWALGGGLEEISDHSPQIPDHSPQNRYFLSLAEFVTHFVAKENNITITFPKEFEYIRFEVAIDNLFNKTEDIKLFILNDLLKNHFYSLIKTNENVFKVVKQNNCSATPIENLWSWY